MKGLKHAALPAEDLKRAINFYQSLGFKNYHVSDPDWLMLYYRETTLSLVKVPMGSLLKREKAVSYGTHPAHLGFVASSTKEVDQMWKKLKNFPGIKLSSKKWHRDKSYGFYFTDTEANSLEWIYIPTVPIYENQNQNELVVLLVHGSKSKKWSLEFDKLVKRIKIEDKQKIWVVAHLEGVGPKINQVIETSLNKYSFNKIKIIPLLFSNGVHMRRDVIAEVRLLKKSFPKFKIILKKSLLEENIFTDFLIDYLLLS